MSAASLIRLTVISVTVFACSGVAALASAQSLADVARKEEERRQKNGDTAKVYTNKDLKGGGVSEPAPATPPATAEAPKDADAGKAKAGDAAADKTDDKDSTKTAAYWSGKLKSLKGKLEQDQAFAEAMQTHINALTTDAVNRDDPIQRSKLERDRQKALADLAKLTTAIVDDKKAIADFEELARRSGIPPGWLR